jgi:predicted HAD superfamily Cof-like phosphohydrolase
MTTKFTFTVTIDAEDFPSDACDILANAAARLPGVRTTVAALGIQTKFDEQVTEFNRMYKLPTPDYPCIPRLPVFGKDSGVRAQLDEYLEKLYSIFKEELDEVEAIREKVRDPKNAQLGILTELADWLGDLQVYCASEMTKFGLPNSDILDIIMKSNMSKLGEDGKPIYDARGKVLKGPGYYRPEPLISKLILNRMYKLEDEK